MIRQDPKRSRPIRRRKRMGTTKVPMIPRAVDRLPLMKKKIEINKGAKNSTNQTELIDETGMSRYDDSKALMNRHAMMSRIAMMIPVPELPRFDMPASVLSVSGE